MTVDQHEDMNMSMSGLDSFWSDARGALMVSPTDEDLAVAFFLVGRAVEPRTQTKDFALEIGQAMGGGDQADADLMRHLSAHIERHAHEVRAFIGSREPVSYAGRGPEPVCEHSYNG